MVSSHSEIPHGMHHLLHGVSQRLCLRKKNSHGISKHLGAVPRRKAWGPCSPPSSAVALGFRTPAVAPGPADRARVCRRLHRRLLNCSVPWPGASTGMLTFFLQLIRGRGQTRRCLLPPSPPLALVLFYVSFQQQLNRKLRCAGT